METLRRNLEERVRGALRTFRVVAIVGPRQAGKTTLARLVGESRVRRHFVSLDDLSLLAAARSDPQGFVRGLRLPVTIDEVQRVPELLLAVKQQVDVEPRPGDFLLTGSADPQSIQRLKESRAGRMAMLPLRPLTWAERLGRAAWNPLSALARIKDIRELAGLFQQSEYSPTHLDVEVALGGFPEPVLRLKPRQRTDWHQQFVKTCRG